jgi:hypothetical protein
MRIERTISGINLTELGSSPVLSVESAACVLFRLERSGLSGMRPTPKAFRQRNRIIGHIRYPDRPEEESMAKSMPEGIDWKAFTPDDSPKTPADLFADPLHRDLSEAKLAEGDVAFDFELPIFDFSDGTRRESGDVLHLSKAAENRPVALIFGSYT